MKCSDMQFHSVNLLLQETFKKNWTRPALSDYKGETILYSDLARRIAKLHLLLGQVGICPQDRVAICAGSNTAWAVSFLSAMTYGVVPVLILNAFTADSVEHLVNHSEAVMLLVDDEIWAKISGKSFPKVRIVAHIRTLDVFQVSSSEYLDARNNLGRLYHEKYGTGIRPADLHYYEDSADEWAVLNYTSGTSGYSKGVMIPYRAILSNVEFASRYAEPQMSSRDRVVSMLPMAHLYGLMFEFLFEISIGAHVVFLNKIPSPRILLQAMEEIKPSLVVTVPLVIEKLYKSSLWQLAQKYSLWLKIPGINLVIRRKIRGSIVQCFGGCFEEVIIGGAALNPEVERFLKEIGFPYTVGYGMTECAPIIAYAHWKTHKVYSCGKAAPNMEIRIVSENSSTVPGEVQVRGANLFLGYYKDQKTTGDAFTEDGWFKTGDIGLMDREGNLFLKGRSKCMILGSNGQNIYPEEIEYTINNHPLVSDSLVVERDGTLTALVYPDYAAAEKQGLSRDMVKFKMKNTILQEINASLPVYSRIARIECLDSDFERTPKNSIKRFLYQ